MVLNCPEASVRPAPMTGDPESLATKAVTSGVWVVALNLINRGFGILRTVILARLLTPDDFGLLGLALLATATLETLSQTGFHGAIIQKQKNIDSYLNTAWTCSALRGMILFALLYFLSPQVAYFFDDTRVVPIIRVIAISILLSGFANIGIVLFKKELDFKKQFIYETLSNSADIVISIALALWLRTVWALVIGGVAGHIMRLILSYGLHPWRPALSFDAVKFREMFTFGKWMLAAGILHFVITRADDLFVGKFFGVAALGLYQMAYLLSNVTTTDLTHTISQIAFPAYSKIQNDPSTLVNVYLKVLRGVAFISVSVAFFLFAFASELVELLLGGQWVAMVPVLEVLAFAGLARSIQSTAVPVFLAMGRPKIHTEINIIRAVVLFCLVYPFATTWGMLGVAYAVLTSCVVSVLAVSLRISTVINVRVSQFYMSIFVPVLTATTTLVLMSLVKQTGAESGPVRLSFLLLFGASVYLALSVAADRQLKYGMRETVQEAWQHLGLGKKMLLQKAGKQP